jgi:hypothetical protein
VERCGLDASGSVVSSYEHSNEPSGSMKAGNLVAGDY